MSETLRSLLNYVLGIILCVFTLKEVNAPQLQPHATLAIFAMFGLALCFINKPAHKKLAENKWASYIDLLLALAIVVACSYIIIQTESIFSRFWVGDEMLVKRAGEETAFDVGFGIVGLLLVLEATRRAIGWTLPILALLFTSYAFIGPHLPDALFPHRGYPLSRVVAQTFLQDQGVFGVALRIMFKYVFLFVIFGAFLKTTGATQFIVDFSRRIFAKSTGGAAKVAVLSSGMMGSLSGSAVANTMTTGTFTIPLMRSGGFSARMAAGVEAAASSGGALVPPVMGAGAYMMLELVQPTVTFVEIMRAAIIPAVLYYLALFFIVHYYSKGLGVAEGAGTEDLPGGPLIPFEGIIFFTAFTALILTLLMGFTAFRSVSVALLVIIIVSSFHERTRLNIRKLMDACKDAAVDVVPLVTAASCVGIIMGVVFLTGIGTKLPTAVEPIMTGIESAASGLKIVNPETIALLGALIIIMFVSIMLGMGLPSAVCYLLIVTMLGPVLTNLGVVPLAAHFFIFYFGMMSMVTPPVALAAYAAASIAGTDVMKTGITAFSVALAGFTLPFMFVLKPELLMLTDTGELAPVTLIVPATLIAVAGLYSYSLALTGFFRSKLSKRFRIACGTAAVLLLLPGKALGPAVPISITAIIGLVVLIGIIAIAPKAAPPTPEAELEA
ncbi:MAG: TRAP transporter 4TM/12TM fusion protein [Rhodothermales bacterium]